MVESHERSELNPECQICSDARLRDIQIAKARNLFQNDMIHKILQDLDLGRKRLGRRRPARRRHIYCRLQLQKKNSGPSCPAAVSGEIC